MPLPSPAPAWISTRQPARVSSSTPTGIMATRYSCVLISLGTPTTYLFAAMRLPRRRARGPEPASFWAAGAGESRPEPGDEAEPRLLLVRRRRGRRRRRGGRRRGVGGGGGRRAPPRGARMLAEVP